jgi:FkbM family methyltransferase
MSLAKARLPQIIDVGANAGVFTHLVLNINPSARITAVEPQPELARLIEDYARRCGRNIQCKAVACSDHDGQATLFLANAGDVRASLDPTFAAHKQEIKVPVTTVDAIAPEGEIFLLKIDAEGHDIEVLKGATAVLIRTRFVMIECHTEETLAQAKIILKGMHCEMVGAHDFLFYRKA